MSPDWKPSDGLPASATIPKLELALRQTELETMPAPQQAFAVLILKLVKFGNAFGIQTGSIADMTAFYREGFEDVPADLLEQAVAGAIRSWKWGNRMPLPADLRAIISSELDQRKAARFAMERALWKAGVDARTPRQAPKPITPEMQAQVDRILEARRRKAEGRGFEEMTVEQAEAELAANKAKWVDAFVEGQA